MAFQFSSITFDSTSSKYRVNYDNKTIETTVTKKATVVSQWVREVMLAQANEPKVVVGLDVEWRPNTVSYLTNKSATLQLCIGTKCLILQLFYMDEIPHSLKNFLLNPRFTFVGVEVEKDIEKLKNEYGLDCAKNADIRAATIRKWPSMYYRKPGLKHLARDVVNLHMEKPLNVCRSNWDAQVLTEDQVHYACIDAYASYKIAHKLFLE
uniref:Werner Syndrome-like exonuclease n=1 Tax=Erigeron canadensis TaxID=72917 RepID=UPI001CB8C1B2|nr:Werner Syndrome-like exonuclease [Erigeron canadensis]